MKNITSDLKHIFFIVVFLLGITAHSQRQQLGTDLFGAENNYFGNSVALNTEGTTMVVGSSNANVNGLHSGEVNVYTYNGSQWIERGESLKGEEGDQFGSSVAMTPDGSRIIAGASGATTANGANTGKAEVFDWDGTQWIPVGNTINGSFSFNSFGQVVSISNDGNRVAVSAPNFGANYSILGQVKIYEFDGAIWQQMGAEITGEAVQDVMGISMQLSADGNRIAIGSQNNDNAANQAGNIRIFEWSGTAWEQMGAEIGGDAEWSLFGESLSFSEDGNRLVGGAPYFTDRKGYVKILDWDGTSWVQKGQTIYGENIFDEFGDSVALSTNGTTLTVGASYSPGGGYRRGQVHVYKLIGNTWEQVEAPINGLIDSEFIGGSLAISGSGEVVAAASSLSGFHGPYAGVVRVYESGVLKTEDFSSLNKVTIYPVPAKDYVTIDLGETYSEVSLIQYDILGKEINRLNSFGELKIEFQLKGNSGIYFIKISTENNSKTIKIVKD